MADISKINTTEIANIAKIGSVDIGGISKVGNTDVVLTPAAAWASWDESSEAGLASADTFVAMMENVIANGNETGQGAGLTGADLDLTRVGTVAGATGSPLTRNFATGSNQMRMTESSIVSILGDNTWTLIWKLKNCGTADNNTFACRIQGASNTESFYVENGSTAAFRSVLRHNGVTYVSNTVDGGVGYNPPTSGDVYIVYWSDGTYIRCGFTTTKPTKWSDFSTTNRLSVTSSNGIIDAADERAQVIGSSTASVISGDYYYVVASKVALIDNAS